MHHSILKKSGSQEINFTFLKQQVPKRFDHGTLFQAALINRVLGSRYWEIQVESNLPSTLLQIFSELQSKLENFSTFSKDFCKLFSFSQNKKLSSYPGSALKHFEVQWVSLDGPIEKDERVAAGHGSTQRAPWQSLAWGKAIHFLKTGREDD